MIKSWLWNLFRTDGIRPFVIQRNEAHMTASDTLYAYEAGLITQAEATEQALVDRLDELYERATGYRRGRTAAYRAAPAMNRAVR